MFNVLICHWPKADPSSLMVQPISHPPYHPFIQSPFHQRGCKEALGRFVRSPAEVTPHSVHCPLRNHSVGQAGWVPLPPGLAVQLRSPLCSLSPSVLSLPPAATVWWQLVDPLLVSIEMQQEVWGCFEAS